MTYPGKISEIGKLNRERQAIILEFVEAASPKAVEIVEKFANEAPRIDRGLFYPHVLFKIAFNIDPFVGRKIDVKRALGTPLMMELEFDEDFSWSGRKFSWFDRKWYQDNYHFFNPKDIYDSYGDGGIRIYLDMLHRYHYSHILMKKYGDGGLIDVYRGPIGKESLAEILATDYAKTHINKGSLSIDDFINILIETLDSYLPEPFIDE